VRIIFTFWQKSAAGGTARCTTDSQAGNTNRDKPLHYSLH
jgi:hypothetical protein